MPTKMEPNARSLACDAFPPDFHSSSGHAIRDDAPEYRFIVKEEDRRQFAVVKEKCWFCAIDDGEEISEMESFEIAKAEGRDLNFRDKGVNGVLVAKIMVYSYYIVRRF